MKTNVSAEGPAYPAQPTIGYGGYPIQPAGAPLPPANYNPVAPPPGGPGN